MGFLSRQGIARCQSCGSTFAIRSMGGAIWGENPLLQLERVALCCKRPYFMFKGKIFDDWSLKS